MLQRSYAHAQTYILEELAWLALAGSERVSSSEAVTGSQGDLPLSESELHSVPLAVAINECPSQAFPADLEQLSPDISLLLTDYVERHF